MSKQCSIIKGSLVNMDNKFNKVFSFFSLLNPEFLRLDNITTQVLLDSYSEIVVSDTSIKNQIATSISYIYSHDCCGNH